MFACAYVYACNFWVCACKCMYLWRLEEGIRPLVARVIGSCQPSNIWMLGTELRSSARSSRALACWTICPTSRLLFYIKIYFYSICVMFVEEHVHFCACVLMRTLLRGWCRRKVWEQMDFGKVRTNEKTNKLCSHFTDRHVTVWAGWYTLFLLYAHALPNIIP